MIESDLSDGFGLKPGSIYKSKEKRSLSLISVHKDFEPSIFLSNSKYKDKYCDLEDDLIILQKALKSKYDAINILKRIGNKMRMEKIELEDQLLEITMVFKSEIMKLQNELDEAKTLYYDNQRTWLARFNQLDGECLKLKEELKKKSIFIQNLMTDNIDLLEENQSIMKLLTKNKEKSLEIIKNIDNDIGTIHSTELIDKKISDTYNCILRPKSEKNINCHCVCNINFFSKLEFEKVHQIKKENSNIEEAYIMVEAYRLAFEELLKRNREITLKISKGEKQI